MSLFFWACHRGSLPSFPSWHSSPRPTPFISFYHVVIVMCGLSGVLWSIISLTVFEAANFFMMSAMAASVKWSVATLKTGLTLQLFILLHWLLHIGCQSLNLLSHHYKIWGWCCCGFHWFEGALSVGTQWLDKSRFPQMAPNWWSQKLTSLVSMDELWYLLLRKERQGKFIGMMPKENTSMLKSAYGSQWIV